MKNQNNTGSVGSVKSYYDYENSNQVTMFVEPIDFSEGAILNKNITLPNSRFYLTNIKFVDEKQIEEEAEWDKSFADSADVLEMMANKTQENIEKGHSEEIDWNEL